MKLLAKCSAKKSAAGIVVRFSFAAEHFGGQVPLHYWCGAERRTRRRAVLIVWRRAAPNVWRCAACRTL